jgi:enoyl-CoA hydratase
VIELDDIDGVAVVRLAHGKVNALDLELLTEITRTFGELDAGPVRAIVLTGAGRAFSAGADLWRILDGGADYIAEFVPALTTALETVFNVGKPVVAAINGPAIAGGCILASCADRRIMADGAGRIGVTELLVGVPFPVAAMEILTYAAGPQLARDAVLTGAMHDPAEAVARGLVDEVVAPLRLLESALQTARRLATSIPADTYRLTKRQLRTATNERIADQRPIQDPLALEVWIARAADGWMRSYLERVTTRR